MVVSRKEFLSLQSKVDQILAAVKSTQPQSEDHPVPQSLIKRTDRLETRERLAAERISLKVEMGIRSLDNNRQADHNEFMATAERLIFEVSAIKDNLQTAIADQSSLSQKLIAEIYIAYESTISVLHATINRLERTLSSNFHSPEILQLTKEIHRLLFNTTIPDNQQLADVLKAHF